MLKTLKLDPAKSQMIWGFVETYLKLTAEKMRRHEHEASRLTPEEAEGLHEGKESLIARLIRRRFGAVTESMTARLDPLSPEQLDDLGEALLDFVTVDDLEQWLAQHSGQRTADPVSHAG